MKRVDIGDLMQQSSTNSQGKKGPSFSIESKCSGLVLIKELNDNDVLQGRGSGSMQNTGNIKFRNLVENIRPAYVATSSRKEKAKMISDMVQLIQSRKGRFLQRLCDKEVEELGLDSHSGEHHREQDHYVEMTDDEAAEKAKQAIRYVHYKKVPLEEERRKKRVAETDYLSGDNKTVSEATHRIDYGGNSLACAPISATTTNQFALSQIPQSNVRAGVTFTPQLKQTDINQLLATFQTAQTAIASQFPGIIYTGQQPSAHQSSVHRDSAQHSSVMRQATDGIIPMVSNVQQHHTTLQRLASSLFPNSNSALPQKVNHAASPLPDTTCNQNTNQQQQQQQTQMNTLLQSIVQQQTSSQPNSILQTILQQQQQQQQLEQQQLNSALQTLQQQQQLASAIQALQQPQKLSPDPQFQQRLQQQKANSILASLLLSANTNSPMGSTLSPLPTHPVPNSNSTTTGMGATNALLTSFLSNNIPQTSAFQETANSHSHGTGKSSQLLGGRLPSLTMNGTNMTVTTAGQQQQQDQGLAGASTIQAIPGLAKNVNTLLAGNANTATQGQIVATAADRNAAKRPRLSSENIADQLV